MEKSTKVCKVCTQTFPRTAEYFHRHPKTRDGFQPKCKACAAAYAAEYRAKHVSRLSASSRVYYASHHTEIRQSQKSYYVENRDAIRAHQKALRESTGVLGQQQRRLYDRRYRLLNDDRLRQQKHAYYQRNRLAFRSWSQAYKARRRAAPGHHTEADVKQQYATQAGKCYWCDKPLGSFERDHVVPLTRGGTNWPENIVVACPTCNRSKGNRLPEDWLQIIW